MLYENYNPNRISDDKYRLYSKKLGIDKDTPLNDKDQNLFYISNVTSFMPDGDNSVDCPEVIIEFYSPDLSFLDNNGNPTKILHVTFIIDYEEYLYGQNSEFRLLCLSAAVNGKVVDIYFPEDTLYDIEDFLEEDYPEAFKIFNGITYDSVCRLHKKLLTRI